MTELHSDAFAFSATGDLAYKKIFPSLQAMVKRGTLNVPVIGVANEDWNLEQFRAGAYDSLERHGGVDRAAFQKLCGLLAAKPKPLADATVIYICLQEFRLDCRRSGSPT